MTEKEKLQTEIENAAKVIKKGGVILYPTDTIWGLGCDATNAKAVKKIFLIKRRTVSKSLIILAESVERIHKHVDIDKEYISDLVNGFDRPTTIIYPGAKKLAKNVIADDGTVAVRLARNDFCAGLIAKVDRPIISTSANISGEPAPSLYAHTSKEIRENVDYIVDWERYAMKDIKPSTVIKLRSDGLYDVLRP